MHTCKDLKPIPFMDAVLQQLVITSPHQVSLLKASTPVTQAPAVSEVSCYLQNTIHCQHITRSQTYMSHSLQSTIELMPPCTNLCACPLAIRVFPKGEHLPQCHSVAPHITSTGESAVIDGLRSIPYNGRDREEVTVALTICRSTILNTQQYCVYIQYIIL